tara:strand:+ start:1355 stop:1906 length:552 start_codon:yes stop_codon:yes gene_type:complete
MRSFVHLVFLISFSLVYSQNEEHEFLKQIIKPVKYNNVEQDSIYLENKYLSLNTLALKGEYRSKESFKWWWDNMGGANPPLFELFISNFSDKEYNDEIMLKRSDSMIHYNAPLIKKVDKNYKSKFKDKFYTSISKPLFNKRKDWCIFITTISQPKTMSSYERVFIYVKVDAIWYEYHSFSKAL